MRNIGARQAWSCALVILVWATGIEFSLYGQGKLAKLSPKLREVLAMPQEEPKDGDTVLAKAQKRRFNAALKEAQDLFNEYDRGSIAQPDLSEVFERLFVAELDLYDTPKERVSVLKRHLDYYREITADLDKQVKTGNKAMQYELQRSIYRETSVEIEWIREKNIQEERDSEGR
jgi:hypothetical protein